jgi:uncharacterized protein
MGAILWQKHKLITFVLLFKKMWTSLAHNVIKYRFYLIVVIAIVTAFMGYHAKDVRLSYDFSKAVPSHDPDMIQFEEFRKLFGEDGNMIVIGMQDSTLYTPKNFFALKLLTDELGRLPGVNGVVSLTNMLQLEKDTENRKFNLKPLFVDFPDDQEHLDSMLNVAMSHKFFSGQLVNERNGATLLIVSVDRDVMNSSKRIQFTDDILRATGFFTEYTGIHLHHAGLPFIRTMVSEKVKKEMQMFLILSVVVTALILLFLFRSWDAVVFPLIIISVVVVWSMGTLALFGYKITLLSGLIPPIIVIIGIPNSIYLLNKFHQEIDKHGNKMKALSRVIRKIGVVTLITNFTTAIGFLVLGLTEIVILKEFGLVTGINILATFVVSLILIPAVFTYLPTPKGKQLKHLNFKFIDSALSNIDLLVHRHKYSVFVVTITIIIISVVGLMKIESVSYMVDDLPEHSTIKKDLTFFEKNFGGVMPMEIMVDTGRKKGALRPNSLAKVDELEQFLDSIPIISKPISIVSMVKAARQAFYNQNPNYYSLPGNDRNFILQYLQGQSDATGLLNNFVDSTGQVIRISMNMADIGSIRMDSLIHHKIQPKIDELFEGTEMSAIVTGSSPLFVKGNKFLIENLRMSLILAFICISFIMAALYMNFRMIVISLIPNIIPLLICAAIMGYFGIPLKPSTAIIFSIAFGISVDYSIHFLAKYRQELFSNNFFVPLAVSKSIGEMGSSMIYTSIVLFAGFIIFAGSGFGGTIALGIMTSTTLLIAMITNLIVLPSLLLAFDDGKRSRNEHPLIEHYDEFYSEDDDEEIDLDLIELKSFGLSLNGEEDYDRPELEKKEYQ